MGNRIPPLKDDEVAGERDLDGESAANALIAALDRDPNAASNLLRGFAEQIAETTKTDDDE